MSRAPEIENTLIFLAEEANAGRVEGLFSVDVRRMSGGQFFTAIHLFLRLGTSEQRQRIYEHLRGVEDVIGEIYAEVEEVKQ